MTRPKLAEQWIQRVVEKQIGDRKEEETYIDSVAHATWVRLSRYLYLLR